MATTQIVKGGKKPKMSKLENFAKGMEIFTALAGTASSLMPATKLHKFGETATANAPAFGIKFKRPFGGQ